MWTTKQFYCKSYNLDIKVLNKEDRYMEYIWLIKQWRIYDFPPGLGSQPPGGATLLFDIIFEENCIKVKNWTGMGASVAQI